MDLLTTSGGGFGPGSESCCVVEDGGGEFPPVDLRLPIRKEMVTVNRVPLGHFR
jgi:hypothetical protein